MYLLVDAWSPGRTFEKLFTLWTSGRELGGWGAGVGGERDFHCILFPNASNVNLLSSGSKTLKMPKPEGLGRGVSRLSAPSGLDVVLLLGIRPWMDLWGLICPRIQAG